MISPRSSVISSPAVRRGRSSCCASIRADHESRASTAASPAGSSVSATSVRTGNHSWTAASAMPSSTRTPARVAFVAGREEPSDRDGRRVEGEELGVRRRVVFERAGGDEDAPGVAHDATQHRSRANACGWRRSRPGSSAHDRSSARRVTASPLCGSAHSEGIAARTDQRRRPARGGVTPSRCHNLNDVGE